uniref:Secreted protein n=1 Tax=Strongyloides venezuelensis TaxID=75913 RepID=A0A0K0FL49_STRVS
MFARAFHRGCILKYTITISFFLSGDTKALTINLATYPQEKKILELSTNPECLLSDISPMHGAFNIEIKKMSKSTTQKLKEKACKGICPAIGWKKKLTLGFSYPIGMDISALNTTLQNYL